MVEGALVWRVMALNMSSSEPLRITVVQIGVLAVLGLFALYDGLRALRNYYTPFILSILFIVGYPLRVADIELAPQRWNVFDYGEFSFTEQAYWAVVAVACVGMCGLIAGQWLAGGRGGISARTRLVLRNEMPLRSWIWTWAILTLMSTFVNMSLRIGTLTTTPVPLFFKLTGILNVTRAYFLPLIGAWLFGLALKGERKKAAAALLLFNFGFGILAIFSTLSKGAILMTLAPYVVCLAVNYKKFAIAPRLLRPVLLALVVVAPVSVIGANVLRYYSLMNDRIPTTSELAQNVDMSVVIGDMSLSERLYKSVILRVVGADLTMGLITVDKRSVSTLAAIVLNPRDPEDAEIIKDAFFVDLSELTGQGRATGLFGYWCIQGHWWVLFIVSALYGWVMIAAEHLVRPFDNCGLSACVAFVSSMLVWEYSIDMMPLFVIALSGVYAFLRFFHYKSEVTAAA
jgi:hypothetical protein